MTTLEQVEKLRDRANVSFEEAKLALEQSNGDLLDALILLERQGKTSSPQNGGFHSTSGVTEPNDAQIVVCQDKRHKWEQKQSKWDYKWENKQFENGGKAFMEFLRQVGRFILKLINIGNTNFLDVSRNGKTFIGIPVIVLVLLLVFMFWWVLPVFVVSLFFKVRYRFRGEQLGKDAINNAFDSAANAAQETADSFGANVGK
jgi:hypothetical protein